MVFAFAGDSTMTRLPPAADLFAARFGASGVGFFAASPAALVLVVLGILGRPF
jgi:hypothetical protein